MGGGWSATFGDELESVGHFHPEAERLRAELRRQVPALGVQPPLAEMGVEMGILPHLPSNSPSLLEQLRSQGGQPGGVPLGSPSEKDCGFSCKDRYELTLRSQCHWDSARLLS